MQNQLKIGICDDEMKIGVELENILIVLLKERKITYKIDIFMSGEELCQEMENTEYDLLFLDIEFPSMNGIEVGSYIREIKNNNVIQIAYISFKQEYAMELFNIRPIDFLIKPLEMENVKKVIDTYIKVNGGKTDVFQYQKGYSHYKIEIYKILYFVRESRKVKMYTTDEVIEFYESMEKIYDRLKNYGFLFIHKSYMVNYRYLKKIAYDHVIMTDGETFSISQSRRKEIRDIYQKLEAD